jgi:hypothetical protein
LVSVGGGLRYWLDSPDSGAEGLGLRFRNLRITSPLTC